MLSDYMSLDTFMKGVTAYLKKFSYGNAVTSDLWDSLGEAAGMDVTALMKSWTHQVGAALLLPHITTIITTTLSLISSQLLNSFTTIHYPIIIPYAIHYVAEDH